MAAGATAKTGTSFFSKALKHIKGHKMAYGAGALGLGAAAYFLGGSSKPQNGPSTDTFQSSQTGH